MKEPEPLPPILTSCGGGRRRTICVSNSPEFEFCNSFSQHNFLSADELFSGGVLLPLHHLRLSNDAPPPPESAAPDPESSGSDQAPPSATEAAKLMSATSKTLSSSKRWRDIFRKKDNKSSRRSVDIDAEDHSIKAKDIISSFKEKKREKRSGGVTSAELNINIWPFSRSRSAGNAAARPRSVAAAVRKVTSAPCSRSNSAGESKSRRWPSSPGRGGVHLGRSSPVWQVRRSGGFGRRSSEAVVCKDGNEGRRKIPLPNSGGGGGRSKAGVLSLGVPMCIGYRQHLNCRSENSSGDVALAAGTGGGGGVSGEGLAIYEDDRLNPMSEWLGFAPIPINITNKDPLRNEQIVHIRSIPRCWPSCLFLSSPSPSRCARDCYLFIGNFLAAACAYEQ